MEEAAAERDVVLLRGRDLIGPDELADGIHPDDEGHRMLAQAIGAEVAKAVGAAS
jgi:lysophospholipase L1-like esterase